jgi:hypothetical protein
MVRASLAMENSRHGVLDARPWRRSPYDWHCIPAAYCQLMDNQAGSLENW